MPFSGPNDADLPQNVKGLSLADRKRWVAIFNKAMADCEADDPKTCEAQAFKLANGVMKKMMAHIQANASGPAWRVTKAGKDYLVAPYVGIVPGVLNGELVLSDEASKYPESWNGRPVVLGHPQENGQYISANHFDILEQALGRIHNSQWVDNRLKFEAWLDIERIRAMGGDALEALERIEAGQPTEGSTAYWRDLEATPGNHNGQPYSAIARNMRPDHYAILLTEPGACSWADGCGGPRINANTEGTMLSINGKRRLGNLMTKALTTWIDQENTRQKVIGSLAKKAEMDPADFEKALAGQLELDEETARRVGSALGIPEEEVTKAMATEPALEPAANIAQQVITALKGFFSTNQQPPKEAPMTDKCKAIDSLIANGCKVKRESLEAMDEATLQALGESFPDQPAPAPAPEPTPAPTTNTTPPPAIPEEIQVLASAIKELGGVEGLKATLATIQANTQNERASLTQEIVANSQMSETDLAPLGVEALKKLAQQVRPAHYFRPLPTGSQGEWEDYTVAQNGN